MFLKKVNILTLKRSDYPPQLLEIEPAVKQLYYSGEKLNDWINRPKLAIVGSRKVSDYGRRVTSKLASDLAKAGVVIISGLAYGVDAEAHRATLLSGGTAVAVLPATITKIYPVAHGLLAEKIITQGGTLISEYDEDSPVYKENFIARNRIVSGLADGVLITEAAARSGSLHTARFALDQGKTVMAVPGNITSPQSEGANNLIKSGAFAVTICEDVLHLLNIKPIKTPKTSYRGTHEEETVLRLIEKGVCSQEELAITTRLSGPEINQALTGLEIAGVIKPLGSGNWVLG